MSSVRRSQFGPLGWPEQWLRVRRWHQRVAPILADPPPPRSPGEADAADDVFAFFMNCYHLQDWLKNDQSDPHPEAEKFVNDTEVLRICRDLCNGLKHAVLDERRRTTTYPTMTTTAAVLYDSVAGITDDLAVPIVQWLIVLDDGDERDTATVADECIKAWQRFIGGLTSRYTG
jgi:hypothetical protein